jgi:hypothetical protein
MMVADGDDVRPRLVDLAVDHPLGIELHLGLDERSRVERELQDVGQLNQLGRARARQQVAPGIAGVAAADMAEGVEHAFMGENAVGDGKLVAHLGEGIGHGADLFGWKRG